MIKAAFRFLLIGCVVVLAACQSPGRYAQHQDSAPTFEHAPPDMRDAEPRYEPYRAFNSRPYEVLGKQYYPIETGKGFVQEGYASWYGQKFHGHLTSNGETYNMFAMTAAHKTLPLPSYVKVTNLANNQTAIVRVNDRGPFHDNRVIDLSYAAAQKLGYAQHGTAKVKLEVIYVDEQNNVTVGNQPPVPYAQYVGIVPAPAQRQASSQSGTLTVTAARRLSFEEDTPKAEARPARAPGPSPDGVFIQVAAVSDQKRAQSLSSVLSTLYQVPAEIPFIDNIYKLRLGPLRDRFKVQMLLDDLKNNGYPNAYTVSDAL